MSWKRTLISGFFRQYATKGPKKIDNSSQPAKGPNKIDNPSHPGRQKGFDKWKSGHFLNVFNGIEYGQIIRSKAKDKGNKTKALLDKYKNVDD